MCPPFLFVRIEIKKDCVRKNTHLAILRKVQWMATQVKFQYDPNSGDPVTMTHYTPLHRSVRCVCLALKVATLAEVANRHHNVSKNNRAVFVYSMAQCCISKDDEDEVVRRSILSRSTPPRTLQYPNDSEFSISLPVSHCQEQAVRRRSWKGPIVQQELMEP
jgi:hypothetical protein